MANIKVRLPDGSLVPMSHPDDWTPEQVQEAIHKNFPAEGKGQESPKEPLKEAIGLFSERLKNHPKIAQSPYTQLGGAFTESLINSLGNVANAIPETFGHDKWVGKLNLGIPEPETEEGQRAKAIGSFGGNIAPLVAAPELLPLKAAKFASSLPGLATSGYLTSEGNPIERGIEGVASAAPIAAGKGILAGIKNRSVLGDKLKEAMSYFKSGKDIRNTEKALAEAQGAETGAKEELAGAINERLEPTERWGERAQKNLEKIGGEGRMAQKANLNKAASEAKDAIYKSYNKKYNDYMSSKPGQMKVQEPLSIDNEIKAMDLSTENLSPETKELLNKFGEKTESEYKLNPITMQPEKTITGGEKISQPKVKDYINLKRQLRDERADLQADRQSPTTKSQEKKALTKQIDKLFSLERNIDSKIKNTVGSDEYKALQDINEGYSKEYIPFREVNTLKNMTGTHYNIGDNVFHEMTKENVGRFLENIKGNHPKYYKSLVEHEFENIRKMDKKGLEEILKSDFGRYMPEKYRKQIERLHLNKVHQEALTKALGKVSSTGTTRKVRATEIKKIIEQQPKLAEPFKNVEDQQKQVALLKKKLAEQKLDKAEVKDAITKFLKAKKLAGGLGLGVAAVAGYKSTN